MVVYNKRVENESNKYSSEVNCLPCDADLSCIHLAGGSRRTKVGMEDDVNTVRTNVEPSRRV